MRSLSCGLEQFITESGFVFLKRAVQSLGSGDRMPGFQTWYCHSVLGSLGTVSAPL